MQGLNLETLLKIELNNRDLSKGAWEFPFLVTVSKFTFFMLSNSLLCLVCSAGIGQGFRRSMFSVAAILGPLWAGSALAFRTYYVLLGVPVALLAFVMVS